MTTRTESHTVTKDDFGMTLEEHVITSEDGTVTTVKYYYGLMMSPNCRKHHLVIEQLLPDEMYESLSANRTKDVC
jgi:hypothetical protein